MYLRPDNPVQIRGFVLLLYFLVTTDKYQVGPSIIDREPDRTEHISVWSSIHHFFLFGLWYVPILYTTDYNALLDLDRPADLDRTFWSGPRSGVLNQISFVQIWSWLVRFGFWIALNHTWKHLPS